MTNITGFYIGADEIDKLDTLRYQRGKSRSEALRYIIKEYFNSESGEVIDELENIKHQNRELKYQLDDIKKTISEQHSQLRSLLLLLGGRDELFKKKVRERFPQFWEKK